MGHSKKNAIVVGSGPLGAVVVRRLVEAGVRVTLIEQGAALSRPAGSHIRNAGQYQTDPDAFLADIMPHFEFFDREAAPEGLPGASVLSAYGGQGICWTNNCPRAVPDLELWPMPSGFS
jgi:choline dehydrogenase-like flavoprotein